MERKRVVVLGGGFGGAYCAQELGRHLPPDWDLTLIDRNNYLLFYPLLVEAGVGNIEPRHVVVPLRYFMKRGERRMAEIVGVNLASRKVRILNPEHGIEETVSYDHLVLAIGSVTKLPNIPGLKEHGFQLKSLGDAIGLRDRAVRLLEAANATSDKAERKEMLGFIVAGSNYTGIEVAGEFQDFLVDAVRAYPNLKKEDIRVTVLEMADRILPALDEELAEFARSHLEQRGIRILTKTSAKEVGENSVCLTNGEVLPGRTLVWAAGIAPSPVLSMIEGLPVDAKGFIRCGRDFVVEGLQNVWAVGDSAFVPDKDGKPHAATAQNATRMGVVCAQNILRQIAGEPLKDFHFDSLGSLAALGCRTAVAKVFGVKISGFLAWWMYRTVYLGKIPSLSRKVRIVTDWTVDLFFRRDPVELGLHR